MNPAPGQPSGDTAPQTTTPTVAAVPTRSGDTASLASAPTAPVPVVPQAGPDRPPSDPARRAFLAVTAVLFFGWLAWLSYTALTKSREPIVSRSQAALAHLPVVAKVDADDKGAPVARVTVVEALRPDGPPKDTKLNITNLPSAQEFPGAGEYLLLLEPGGFTLEGVPVFRLVGSSPSSTDSEPKTIYRWTPDVEAQARRLYRAKD